MGKLLSMGFYIAIAIFYWVCAQGAEDKAVELLFIVLATLWVMHGIVMDKLNTLEEKL